MTDFALSPSRAQRSRSSNRDATIPLRLMDRIYDYSAAVTQKKVAQPVKFESSCGHRSLASTICVPGPYDSSGSGKSAIHGAPFSKLRTPGHELRLRYERNDFVKLQIGTTSDTVSADIRTRFARPLSRGSGYCKFDKSLLRDQREHAGYYAHDNVSSSGNLHVKHSVVDGNVRGPAPWRPDSAPLLVRRIDDGTHPKHHQLSMDPLHSFLSTRRSIARNATFSKAPRKI